MRKILSIIVLLLGVGFFIYSCNLSQEVSQADSRISDAEEQVQDERRPMFGPVRKSIREEQSENAQDKIEGAKQEVIASQVTAQWLQSIGIALFVIGAGSFIYSVIRKKRK